MAGRAPRLRPLPQRRAGQRPGRHPPRSLPSCRPAAARRAPGCVWARPPRPGTTAAATPAPPPACTVRRPTRFPARSGPAPARLSAPRPGALSHSWTTAPRSHLRGPASGVRRPFPAPPAALLCLGHAARALPPRTRAPGVGPRLHPPAARSLAAPQPAGAAPRTGLCPREQPPAAEASPPPAGLPDPSPRGAWRASGRRAPAAFFPSRRAPLRRALLSIAAGRTCRAPQCVPARRPSRFHPDPSHPAAAHRCTRRPNHRASDVPHSAAPGPLKRGQASKPGPRPDWLSCVLPANPRASAGRRLLIGCARSGGQAGASRGRHRGLGHGRPRPLAGCPESARRSGW